MSLNAETVKEVEKLVTRYLVNNKSVADQSPEWKEDLLQETILVLLQGYRGVKVDGNKYFAVQTAATRLGYQSACSEATDFDFSDEGVGVPRVSPSPDPEADVDLKDWMVVNLDMDELLAASMKMQNYTQGDIAETLGVSQQRVSEIIKNVRIKALKGGLYVN